MLDKRNYPLNLAREIASVLGELRNLALANNFHIEVKENNDMFYAYNKQNSNFYFRVFSPYQKVGFRAFFKLEYKPNNEDDLELRGFELNKDEVINDFNKWMHLLKSYDPITFNEEERFQRQYEEEFFAEFEILDNDAEISAFNHLQQKILYKFLDVMEFELEKNNIPEGKLTEIINETKDLKENIQNLNKKTVLSKFAKILAKTKKQGLKLFNEVFDIAKKETIKAFLNKGFDEFVSVLNKIDFFIQ